MDTWMIRAGRGGVYAKSWVEAGIVGIGWDFDGANIASMTQDQLRQAYTSAHPDYSTGKIGQAISQTSKFAHDVAKGSTVVTYDPEERIYHIGKVVGDCTAVTDIDGITYKRNVEWERVAPRDLLATSSRNSLGSLTTVFGISPEVAADLNRGAGAPEGSIASDEAVPDADDDEARFATYDDGIERIKDRALSLNWEEMEQLWQAFCSSMGYHADVSPEGTRRWTRRCGLARPSGPRVAAHHRRGQAPQGPHGRAAGPRVHRWAARGRSRALRLHGGFTKEARYEADRANVPVRLLDLDGLIRLYVSVYDNADEETRSLLPLTRIWWPA